MKQLLEVKDLKTHFSIKPENLQEKKAVLKAVDGVSFDVYEGEILGIVGESGCGKSTLGRTVLRLEQKTEGLVKYRGSDIYQMSERELKKSRTSMQMIFQDPYSSLNPRKKISSILEQPLRIHNALPKNEIPGKIDALLDEIGLNPKYKNRFPHQFSGGQRQRIGIARALALEPEFIVCDEAVSALDVSVQAQILNLLLDLQDRYSFTYLFIAHDLSVVEFISNRIMVMYLGRIVEYSDKDELENNHLHPYTKALFSAFPSTNPRGRENRKPIVMGDVPSPINPPSGCHFHPRCPVKKDICMKEYPEMKEVAPGHFTACHLY
ncbi:MAG: ATP-binding cassette domain-containing protein [Spirochaetales bacterium]|nr:ATP-binding cassette domain-containing protein [Spirochaetales bacterium]